MFDRERCEALILDYVYGLLESAEVAELESYLATHPDGDALRQRAEEWKQQLAVAAKSEFPAVQFAPPSAPPSSTRSEAAKPIRPATPAPKPAKRSNKALWAIAGSALVLVLGLGIPAGYHFIGHWNKASEVENLRASFEKSEKDHVAYTAQYNARRERAEAEEKAATALNNEIQKQFNAALEAARTNAQAEHVALEKQFEVALAEARKAVQDKQFIVRFTGPERAQPGAPNEWQLEMYRRNGTKAQPSKIEWVVKDQTGKEIYRDEKEAPSKAGFVELPKINLPVAFWEKVKPNSDLVMEVIAHDDRSKANVSATIKLARPVFITHLATDKPLYKPGETVYFRSLTLDRSTFTPPEKDMQFQFRITKPDSTVTAIDAGVDSKLYADPNQRWKQLVGPDKKPIRGIGCGELTLEPNMPGGEYKLTVVDVTPSYDEVQRRVVNREVVLETRKFNVAEYKPEIFEKTLEFDGKSYGTGDTVMVKFTASRTQGGKVKNGVVTTSVQVDGQNIEIAPSKTDDEGVARFKFVLPKNITKGEGTISVTVRDAADAEPIHRPIPLVGRIINVEFFPEGGDLVIGVPSRVYFQATTHTGKPADIKGIITDGTGTVAEVSTLTDADHPGVNRGQGVFTFTPKANKTYYLKLSKPSGIIEPIVRQSSNPAAIVGAIGLGNLNGIPLLGSVPTGFELPKAKDDGVVLTAIDPLTLPDQPIRVKLETAKAKKTVVVGAYTRSRLVDHQRIELEPGKAVELKLNPNTKAGGVTRLTVFEERTIGENKQATLIPLAERLVYRRSAEQLLLNVQPDKNRYNPGSQVTLELFAKNEGEKDVPAIVMVAVVNQNVLTMADEKTGRLMPTHFLLASEVKKPEDLEHADFLVSEDPKTLVQAAKALDLLLGTQGWRRFAEQQMPSSAPSNGADVDRMLVANGQRSNTPVETLRQEENKVIAEYKPKFEVSLRKLTERHEEMKVIAEYSDRTESASTRLASARQTNEVAKAEFVAVKAETSRLLKARDEANRRLEVAKADLRTYDDDRRESRSVIFGAFCLGLLVIAGAAAVVGFTRKGRASTPWLASAAGAFGVCVMAIVAVVMINYADNESKQVAMSDSALIAPDGSREVRRNRGFANDPRADFAADQMMNAPAEAANKEAFGGVMPARGGAGGGFPGGAFPAGPPMMAPRAAEPQAPGPFAKGAKKDFADAARKFAEAEKAKLNAMPLDDAKGDLDRFDRRNGLAQNKDAKKLYDKERGEARNLAKAQNNLREEVLRQRLQGRFADEGRPGASPPPDFEQRDMMEREAQTRLLEQAPGFFVREYKFAKTGDANIRDDFTETVYWHPALVVSENGRAQIQFGLSDSITRYQVLVSGHTLDGRIGAVTTHIEARKPFTVDPKTPIEVNANDRIDVAVRFVNDSDLRRAITFTVDPITLKPLDESLLQEGKIKDFVELNANEKKRKIISFKPMKEGEATITILANSNPPEMPDNISRKFRVVAEGFPSSGAASDLLEKRANVSFDLPEQMVPGTLKVKLNVYPTTLSDLQAGLEGLLREPNGCFEQTSTSNYPNLLILDYLKSADQAKPELAQRAKDLLDRGYAKLVSFECPQTGAEGRCGFEWFGQMDQQHQALTAYGLLQFKDLSKVFKVDPALIQRTQTYLLAQRDGQGGFKRNARALDTFGRAPDHTTNAYIVWALVESDPDDKEGMDLTKEFAALKKQAKEDAEAKDDPYFLALVANSLMLRPTGGNREAAIAILDQIVEKHLKNGCVEGAKTSITRSGGRDLQIETTALTVLGWLRSGEPTKFIKPIKETTKWIGQQRGGYGGFGSTQSTILALKALIEHTKVSKRPAEDGEIRLTIGGKTFKKPFTKADQEVITLELPADAFKSSVNDAAVEITTAQAYPFSVAWSCNTLKPQDTGMSAVAITTKLDRKNAVEGEMVKLDVTLKNKKNEGHGMAVAIVGLPGGTRIPADQKELTKLREDGKISYFEIRGRELILYWRSMAPNQTIDVSLGLICEIPGEYRGPASRGYLYYNADHKNWVDPLSITIAPSAQPGFDDVATK